MFLLLLLALAVLVSTCPPPLNDFKFLGNETHTTADMVRTLVAQSPGMGWTEVVSMSGEARTTWPGGHVPYCFTDETARSNLELDIQAGWKLWYDKIGDPGEAYEHTLTFFEYAFGDGIYPYCYSKGTQNWNPAAPHDLAMIGISTTPDVQAWSIAGYIPTSWSNDEPGRHGSRFNLESKARYPHDYWITTVAHELGHIFGFWHEHQREDRGNYVRFDCSKVKGYADAKAKVEHKGAHTMEQVCNNYYLAVLYDFDAIQDFDTIDHIELKDGKEYPLFITTDFDFDDNSIMLYSSAEFMDPNGDANDVMQVPLSYWKHRGIGFTPPSQPTKNDLELIPVNWVVSSGDYEGVCHLYPY